MDENSTVFIVDDDSSIRQALELLMSSAGLTTRSFASGRAVLDADLGPGPCCVLLDLSLPDKSGLEVQAQLRRKCPYIPVVFLTGYGNVPAAVSALKHGAVDFFQKPDFDSRLLLTTITQALEGHGQHFAMDSQHRRIRQGIAALTPRELEVARQAAAGTANKVIGIELGISERTVEVHRGHAMKKMGLRQAADLIRAESLLKEFTDH